jgi:hypothetical protein
MAYLSIENLYRSKAQEILLFKELYALEKVHGTSANISWKEGKVSYFPGGESLSKFKSLFNEERLVKHFTELGHEEVVVYGEAYGGSCQKMSYMCGPELRFIVFDVFINNIWLDVPNMDEVATRLEQEVVPWRKIVCDLAAIDNERDRPSEVAVRRGFTEEHIREGVVLRPLAEMFNRYGERMIVKHKHEKFGERKTPQKVEDPSKLKVLTEATAIAEEWVTEMRLEHVLQKLPQGIGLESMQRVLQAMVEDVLKESTGEIVDSKEVRNAINKKTVELFKKKVNVIKG